MSVTEAYVPIDLLVCNQLKPAAKLLAALLIFERTSNRSKKIDDLLSPTRLEKRTGISRLTIRNSLKSISESRWTWICLPPAGNQYSINMDMYATLDKVRIPEALLAETNLHPQARIMYGILQGLPDFQRGSGTFTYRSLGVLTKKDPRTVATAIQQLVVSGWLEIQQAHRRSNIRFKLCNPVVLAQEKKLKSVKRRIAKSRFIGEALMREYLTLIVDSDEFEDNAAPGFLINPLTDERLQFDRFYPPSVAFEFNGPQHYRATEIYSEEEASKQRARDLIKTGICSIRGITLVVIHAQDLNLEIMKQKVRNLLPQRDLRGCDLIINYLEGISRAYRRQARRMPVN